jgi:TRAP-type C4-dicarboxylate transport system permease small subunit
MILTMEKVNSILQITSALFFGFALVFFLTYDRMWDQPLESNSVVTWMLVGLLIHLLVWGSTSLVKRNLNREIASAEAEKKELKAMLFDMERANKSGKSDHKIEGGDIPDRESSSIKPRENFK